MFGKYTGPDFDGEHYDSNTARGGAATFVSLACVAGQRRGVGVVLSRFPGADISVGASPA